MRRIEHPFNIDQFKEDHQPNRHDGIVGGADHLGDVVIHLIGHQPKLLEDESLGNLDRACVPSLGGVPGEPVQPFARLRHELGRAVNDAPRDRLGIRLFAVVDDRFLGGIELQGLFALDLLVQAQVEPDLCGADQMLLPAVTIPDDQEFPGVGDEMPHRLKDAAPAPDPFRSRDDLQRTVRIADWRAELTFFDDVKKHTRFSERLSGILSKAKRLFFEVFQTVHSLLEFRYASAQTSCNFADRGLPFSLGDYRISIHVRPMTLIR